MAGTATSLRTTPGAVVRRGNHPAGRALVNPPLARPVERLAPVVPLHRGAVVVPLRRAGRPVAPAPAPVTAPVTASTPPSAAIRPTGRPGGLRLTRRGRAVLSGLGVVTALGLAAVVGPALAGSGDPALELAGRSSVVVHSGDTLWSIAESVAPDADPRAVVDALREANDLDGVSLVPGQVLVLP